MQRAIQELQGLILDRYPDARFRIERSPEEPRIVHLWATVDAPDTDAMLETIIDRVTELQIEQHLPIHVIPVRPRERIRGLLPTARAEHDERGDVSVSRT
jgi:hypothetical protein